MLSVRKWGKPDTDFHVSINYYNSLQAGYTYQQLPSHLSTHLIVRKNNFLKLNLKYSTSSQVHGSLFSMY